MRDVRIWRLGFDHWKVGRDGAVVKTVNANGLTAKKTSVYTPKAVLATRVDDLSDETANMRDGRRWRLGFDPWKVGRDGAVVKSVNTNGLTAKKTSVYTPKASKTMLFWEMVMVTVTAMVQRRSQRRAVIQIVELIACQLLIVDR